MKKNNYYTFNEIVSSLREDYLSKEELLKKMNTNIEVIDDNKIESILYLTQKNSIIDDSDKALRLDVSKKSDKLDTKFRKLLNSIFYSDEVWLKDNAPFIYNKEMNEFVYNNYLQLKDISYIPSINIVNPMCFNHLYQQLKSTSIYNLKKISIPINYYQSLLIDINQICLNNYNKDMAKTTLEYSSISDTLSIHSKEVLPSVIVNDLLETKIPKYEFTEEYYNLLESRKERKNYYYVDGGLIGKNDNYSFQDNSHQLVLTKKRGRIK